MTFDEPRCNDDYYTRTGPVIVELLCEAERSAGTEEIDRAEWNAMTPAERAKTLDDMLATHMANAGGGGWRIPDPDDEAEVGTAPTASEVLRLVDEYRAADETQAADLRERIRKAIDR